ncbi:MAG: hypothetical protein K2O05_02160 [Anaeroplasmataceae bacterium]|nr:hypothetical protein [Anaeroplasmataceae bacterium]
MKNLKVRYIWISVAISFVLGGLLIFLVTQTKGNWTTFVIVLIAIDFIYMTLAIQLASSKSFRYKAKPRKYPTKTLKLSSMDLDELLKSNGYQPRVTPYGISYLKVTPPHAYKVVLIKNCEKYFNHEEEQSQGSSNKKLEKCLKFIGCEIFLTTNEEVLKKLPDFNLQGEKIYYCGYYLEDGKLICPNYLEPENEFDGLYQQVVEDLKLQEDVEESSES